jgi:hypothetical protein
MSYDAPEKYRGTGTYGALTEGEQATWDEYTNLRAISDWPGFDAAQDGRRADSRTWLLERSDYIAALANGEVEGEKAGWDTADRGQRYDYLAGLNSGSPKHEVRLPCSGKATVTEQVYIEEREVYLAFGSQYADQKARKQANVDWLVDRRKRVWHLMADDAANNDANDRQQRYDNLCIATHYGSAYEDWAATHNKWGEPITPGGTGRDECMKWCKSYLGVSEKPANSNKGEPQPSGWQRRVYGGDGVPWCACFSVCSAWDNGVNGSGTASCANNIDLAKRGEGIYRGYTTDATQVRRGDHFFIGGNHTGVVRSDDCTAGSIPTYEGNTSPGSEGSQYNGGTTAERTRSMSGDGVTGFGLVRFPD